VSLSLYTHACSNADQRALCSAARASSAVIGSIKTGLRNQQAPRNRLRQAFPDALYTVQTLATRCQDRMHPAASHAREAAGKRLIPIRADFDTSRKAGGFAPSTPVVRSTHPRDGVEGQSPRPASKSRSQSRSVSARMSDTNPGRNAATRPAAPGPRTGHATLAKGPAQSIQGDKWAGAPIDPSETGAPRHG
jgi:hypothetical protein